VCGKGLPAAVREGVAAERIADALGCVLPQKDSSTRLCTSLRPCRLGAGAVRPLWLAWTWTGWTAKTINTVVARAYLVSSRVEHEGAKCARPTRRTAPCGLLLQGSSLGFRSVSNKRAVIRVRQSANRLQQPILAQPHGGRSPEGIDSWLAASYLTQKRIRLRAAHASAISPLLGPSAPHRRHRAL
jgi:hypothetical protein